MREEKQTQQTVRLIDSGSETIGYYLQVKQVNPKVREALQKVVTLRDRLDQTAAVVGGSISGSRTSLRSRPASEKTWLGWRRNSELYNRYVSKLDQQETEIEKLRKEIETLKATEDRQKRELNDYLLGLDLD